MARGFVEKKLDTTICDVVDAPAEELVALGARRAASPRELADRADLIGVCVRDDDDVRQICFGENGFFQSPNRGAIIAIHSTVSTDTIREVAAAAEKHGMCVLDAPVTGGPVAAEAGALTYMVGGDRKAFDTYRPAFETSAKSVVYTGPLCSATYTKICNNLLQYVAFTGVFEAFTLIDRLGVDRKVLEEVTRSNGLLNDSNGQYMNGVVASGDDLIKSAPMQSYMQGRLGIAEKDLALAIDEARRVGLAIPATALVSQLMGRVYRVEDPDKR
jgi:3-hydroxyisobutyrate dehydrogenase